MDKSSNLVYQSWLVSLSALTGTQKKVHSKLVKWGQQRKSEILHGLVSCVSFIRDSLLAWFLVQDSELSVEVDSVLMC